MIYFGFCFYSNNDAVLIFKYNRIFTFKCIKENEVPAIKIQGYVVVLVRILYLINILLKLYLLVQENRINIKSIKTLLYFFCGRLSTGILVSGQK